MPYLPPSSDAVKVPIDFGADYRMQIRFIENKWNRYFGLTPYYSLIKLPTYADPATAPAGTQPENVLSGEAGTSKFDPVWGEAVDPGMTTWTQATASGTLQAFDPAMYRTPVSIPIRVEITAMDEDLHRWGFDEVKDGIAMIPSSILDAHSITAKAGDVVNWSGRMYDVKQISIDGRWKNTNVYFYRVCQLQTRLRGN